MSKRERACANVSKRDSPGSGCTADISLRTYDPHTRIHPYLFHRFILGLRLVVLGGCKHLKLKFYRPSCRTLSLPCGRIFIPLRGVLCALLLEAARVVGLPPDRDRTESLSPISSHPPCFLLFCFFVFCTSRAVKSEDLIRQPGRISRCFQWELGWELGAPRRTALRWQRHPGACAERACGTSSTSSTSSRQR